MNSHRPQESADTADHYKWKALFTTAMGALMTTIDFSITNIAFPSLTRIFEKDITTVMWVTLAYILVSTSAMLILGRISDIVGRKIVFMAGMLIFTAALICCSLARSVEQLIFFRCFQGLGAAMNVSCGTAIVTEAFPPREIGRGLGLMGMAVSLGFIIGPVLGGFLLDWLDWRSIFYVRAPFCLITLLLGIFLLKADHRSSQPVTLDLRGAFTSSLGIFCLVYGLSRTSGPGFLSLSTFVWAGSGVLILGVFILLERTAGDPIVDLSLFRNRTFTFASMSMVLTFVSAPPFFLIMPFYLIEGIQVTPSEAGLLLTVNSAVCIICGPISGALSDRFGAQRFAAAGAAATVAAFLMMMFFDIHTGMLEIVFALAILGIGIGMFQSPNSSLFMGSVPRNRVGSASALLATLRQVGISVGMALAGALYASRLASHQLEWVRQGAEESEAVRLSVPLAFHETLLFSIVLGMVAIVFCLVNRREKSEGY